MNLDGKDPQDHIIEYDYDEELLLEEFHIQTQYEIIKAEEDKELKLLLESQKSSNR